MKLRKKVAALLMCGAIGVLNCMPVCAATEEHTTHDMKRIDYGTYDTTVRENCSHCGICTSCTDEVKYHVTWETFKCTGCSDRVTIEDWDEYSRACCCSEPSCCY